MRVAELIRMLFSQSDLGKGLAVLTAYFDDSGTHAGSPVVLMGGVWGNDAQWTALEREWAALLRNPGKEWEPLKRFHMYDCEHGEGEFFGHTKGACDHLVYRFRNLILDAGLHGYAMAVSAPDWADLVTGDYLAGWGDGERFSATTCLMTAMEWAERESVETEVAFVFDDRPQRRDANQRVFAIYQDYAAQNSARTKPVAMSFLNSDRAIPLQAADMFAWESNRFATQWRITGPKTKPRAHFRHFLETGRFKIQWGSRDAIQAMVNNINPGSPQENTLKRLATYFRAPSPDLAWLSKEAT